MLSRQQSSPPLQVLQLIAAAGGYEGDPAAVQIFKCQALELVCRVVISGWAAAHSVLLIACMAVGGGVCGIVL